MRIVPQSLGYPAFAVFAPLALAVSTPVRVAAKVDHGTAAIWIRRGTYGVMTLAIAILGTGYLAGMYNW